MVGRMIEEPNDNGFMKVAVSRNFKNSEGIYETDFIPVQLWGEIAKNTMDYCKVGNVIGIKGRLQSETFEVNDHKYFNTYAVAERVTFLSSKSDKPTKEEC